MKIHLLLYWVSEIQNSANYSPSFSFFFFFFFSCCFSGCFFSEDAEDDSD